MFRSNRWSQLSDAGQVSVYADPGYRPKTDATRLRFRHWRFPKWLMQERPSDADASSNIFTSAGWAIMVVVILLYVIFGPG